MSTVTTSTPAEGVANQTTAPSSKSTGSLPSIEEIAQAHAARSAAKPSNVTVVETASQAIIGETPVTDAAFAPSTEEVVAAEPTTEAASETPVEPTKTEPKPDPMSSKFAALARKEREARRMAAQAEQRMQDAEARAKAAEERVSRFGRLKSDPLGVLKEEGLSYNDLTMHALGAKPEEVIDPVDAKLNERLAKFTPELEKLKQLEAEQAQYREERRMMALDKMNQEIHTAVVTGGDKYEIITALGQEGLDTVRDVISEYYAANKKILTYEEACDMVEGYYESYAESFTKTKKIQSKFAPKAPVAPTKPSTPKIEAKAPTTLTNTLTQASQAINLDNLPKHQALEILTKKYIGK